MRKGEGGGGGRERERGEKRGGGKRKNELLNSEIVNSFHKSSVLAKT